MFVCVCVREADACDGRGDAGVMQYEDDTERAWYFMSITPAIEPLKCMRTPL